MAEAVAKLGDSLFGGDDDAPVTVVGYSMGARVALATAAACANEETPSFLKKKRGGGVVSIGGSPGIAGGDARRARAERDDALAETLRHSGVEPFARAWYTQGLFGSLTAHPRFSVARLARRRAASTQNARVRNGDDASASAAASAAAERLAATLSAASPGRQIEVSAASLAASGVRVDFVTGALDAKFVKIAQTLAEETRVCLEASGVTEARVTESTVPGAGHAAHLEAPEALVLRLLRAVRFDEEL
jgi:pimeloyl-ACP methyl ester carboxylesterase